MKRKSWFYATMIFFLLISMFSGAPVQARQQPTLPAAPAVQDNSANSPAAPLDVPISLVGSGVTYYDLAQPKVFWYTGVPACPPNGPQAANGTPETIQRIATYGGLTRTLYNRDAVCNTQDALSNIVADADYVYWVSNSQHALVRLSTNANVGDAPQLLSSQVSGYSNLAQDGTYIYFLSTTLGVWKVAKAGGGSTQLVANPGAYAVNLQVADNFLYWTDSGNLTRFDLTNSGQGIIATGVTGYYPEGSRIRCTNLFCFFTNNVYIGKHRQVVIYNNNNGNTGSPFYTSSDPNGVVYGFVTDGNYVFFLENRLIPCQDLFCSYNDLVVRWRRSDGATDVLFVKNVSLYPSTIQNLKADNDFLFWQDGEAISRLPKNASALPQINMYVGGMEVTQGIQDVFNSVRLIENRRTFVRVYVSSSGDTVPGVTAYLYRLDGFGGVIGGPLIPVNPVGQQINVRAWANRMDLNQSFLFELPWNWLTGTLRLRAVLNPNRVPLEPNYDDNTKDAGPFTLQASPRLKVQFVAFGYSLNNNVYYPRFIQDIIQTYSWIRRAYPLSSKFGSWDDPTPGFRPNLWFVFDDGLASRVNQMAAECLKMKKDDRSLCASAYTNNLLNSLRSENGIPDNIFMYGMISDAAGIFPRGQASGNVSSGPVGSGDWGWDYDGSYADWYAGHEIGHTLGRAHPSPNSDDPATKDVVEGCGQSRSDDNYPYNNAQISDGYAEGFDVGDPGLNPKLQVAVYPGIFWHDVMSYCNNQWLSDYTYNGMYDYMMAHPTSAVSQAPDTANVSGDFLSVYGTIFSADNTASFDHVAHLSSIASIPAITPGAYSIRLIGNGTTLADYAFTPQAVAEAQNPMATFGQVVNFVPGTTQVQIVRVADNTVLASKSISANAPVVSNVALQGASNPVSGSVTLAWNASDADGDPLTFNILYSRDNGATFQPVKLGATGNSTIIDTATLGGSGTAVLRVIANDGANTAQADSAPFVMANKPPQPLITNPADGVHVHYGQLINFSGEAQDVQDSSVADGGLVWSNQNGTLGTGPLLSVTNLPVGVNTITLTATNSKGLSAATSITVNVDDDLNLPGPTLAVGPAQLDWHVDAGATTPQSAEININNAGSGSLDWTASSGAPWLTLSAVSGTAPVTVTVTADPTGIPVGTVVTTTLTVTSVANNQTVTLPVSLAVGDIWHAYGSDYAPKAMYLPVIRR